jgi:FMN-dependent NADH-azoreductase
MEKPMKLLHIDSSILGERSASRALTREIVARLKAGQPDLEVIYRDLAAAPLPHYSAASVAGSDPEHAARDSAVLEEFLAADVLVIGAPLYNFSLPSQLKAWIDRISIKDKTFRYTAKGPEGLAGDKKVIVAVARGGLYAPGAGTEFGESYLKLLFGFLGIKEVSLVRAEGLNVSPEQRESSLRAAQAQIRALPSAGAVALAA